MKKKVGIIASSVATIAVCASMVVGSTYALFTSEDKVDISVTAGNVEVTAVAKNLKTSFDEAHVTKSNVQADFTDKTVTLDKMLPGDIVSFDIVIENKSNVDVKYKTSIKCTEGLELMSGLEFTVGTTDYSGLVSYVTEWSDWKGDDIITVPVTISLPWDAGNEYKNLSCKIAYAVEAVQGNTTPTDESELIKLKVSNAEELESALAYVSENGGNITLKDNINLTSVQDAEKYYNLKKDVTFNLSGKSITTNKGFKIVENANVTVINGTVKMTNTANRSAIYVSGNGNLTVDNSTVINEHATAISIWENAKAKVSGSELHGLYYGFSSNAGTGNYSDGIYAELIDTKLYSQCAGLLWNIPAKLVVNDCYIEGLGQGLIARGGDITVSNSSIIKRKAKEGDNADYIDDAQYLTYESNSWSYGSNVPSYALVVGNRSSSYQYPVNVTLLNVNVEDAKDNNKTVYAYGNDTKGNGANLAYDENSKVGTPVIGNSYAIVQSIKTVSEAKQFADVMSDIDKKVYNNVTIMLTEDLDLSGTAWKPVYVYGYNGIGRITIEGNGATITGLTAPLFKGGFAGNSAIVIKDLTISKSNIVSGNDLGSGAFVECVDSMQQISLVNCHLVGSKLSGSRTGGLIGWTSGYNAVNDGPVKTQIIVRDCTVENCEITGSGSVGGIIGHSGANAWTYTTIENCKIINTKLVSNDDGGVKVGAIVGTANVGETTINHCTWDADTTMVQEKANSTVENKAYGRAVLDTTGKLVIDGVSITK